MSKNAPQEFPSALKEEAILLGRMLKSNNAVNLALDLLDEHDFFDSRHKAIFTCMKLAISQGAMTEPMTIASLLEKHFPSLSDTAYLFGLHLHSYGDMNEVSHFIQEIKKAANYRRMINLAQNALSQAFQKQISPEQIQNELLCGAEAIFAASSLEDTQTLDEILDDNFFDSGLSYLQFIEKQMENHSQGKNTFRGIPTGFSRLDDFLSGFSKGHFIIVGARPGVGKTTFLLNLIYKLTVERGVRVGFFSLEMTAQEAAHKLLAIAAGICAESSFRGQITPEEFQTFVIKSKQLATMPLWIDETESLNVGQLLARAKRWQMTHGIEALFIDYLGEIRGEGKFANKQEEIQAVSKKLRGLAKRLKIPVICVCQLNRQSENENRAPKKADLRESGQIEADAHSILMLHRPAQNDPNDQPGRVALHIVKNRFGKEGIINFAFEGKTGRFYEMDYRSTNQEDFEL